MADKKDDNENVFQKITVGFVIQEYRTLDNGTHVCTEQEFMAGEQVDYEDMNGEPVTIDTLKEVYCPFDMVQPKPIPSTEGLKFVCPNCEGTKLECCMDDGNSSIVTVIHEDGEFEYDGEPTEGDLSHYQCECCGQWLMDGNDCEIQDDEEIVEYIKRECSQD
jgi:hypothetical protein